jgi:hypothetical protein
MTGIARFHASVDCRVPVVRRLPLRGITTTGALPSGGIRTCSTRRARRRSALRGSMALPVNRGAVNSIAVSSTAPNAAGASQRCDHAWWIMLRRMSQTAGVVLKYIVSAGGPA